MATTAGAKAHPYPPFEGADPAFAAGRRSGLVDVLSVVRGRHAGDSHSAAILDRSSFLGDGAQADRHAAEAVIMPEQAVTEVLPRSHVANFVNGGGVRSKFVTDGPESLVEFTGLVDARESFRQ